MGRAPDPVEVHRRTVSEELWKLAREEGEATARAKASFYIATARARCESLEAGLDREKGAVKAPKSRREALELMEVLEGAVGERRCRELYELGAGRRRLQTSDLSARDLAGYIGQLLGEVLSQSEKRRQGS